jgi:uncharacterized damage-inducible protein DinB
MTMTSPVRMLTRYNAWANRVIFEAVGQLPEGEAVKPRQTLFRNMVHTLNHNYVIDLIWQAHLQGRPHGFSARNTADHPPLAELWALQQTVDAWYIAWADEASAQTLEEKVRFTFVGGGEGEMTREQMIVHVVNHTSYHRGFVGDMFCQLPLRPPTTDLPVFLRDAHPE